MADTSEVEAPHPRALHRKLLDQRLLPTFGRTRLKMITADQVEDWHHAQSDLDTPTMTSHAYGLLRTILGDAVESRDSSHRRLIEYKPLPHRGAGNCQAERKRFGPATLPQLAVMVEGRLRSGSG